MRRLIIATLVCAAPCAASTVFVDDSATPGGDGLSWASAFVDLQDALDAARLDPTIDAIHVAEGIYKPDRGTLAQSMSFELVDNVTLLGGFPNAGGDLSTRDPVAKETKLTGDLLDDDLPPDEFGFLSGNNDNALHVVSATSCGVATVLDGFTIQGGNANDCCDYPVSSGGNVLIVGGGPTIRNCVIERGHASWAGGGIASFDATTRLESCVIRENVAQTYGGGAAMMGTRDAEVRDSLFARNIGGSGCGLYCGPVNQVANPGVQSGNATLVERCTFDRNIGNISATAGGGIMVAQGDNLISQCRFTDNCVNGGGGVFVGRGDATIERCVFFGNEGQGDGGGAISATDFNSSSAIYTANVHSCLMAGNNGALIAVSMYVNLVNCTIAHNAFPHRPIFLMWPAIFSQSSEITLSNSIVWGNADLDLFGGVRDHLSVILDGTYTVHDSIVQDWDGTYPGNAWDADPGFASTSGLDGEPHLAVDNNYHLLASSPAVDSGSNGLLPVDATLDVEGNARIRNGNDDAFSNVDIGAFERCRIDTNADGLFTSADVIAFVSNHDGPDLPASVTDLDGDADTDLRDFAYLQRHLPTGCE